MILLLVVIAISMVIILTILLVCKFYPSSSNESFETDLITKWMPVYYFSKQECFWPVDVDTYLENCTVVDTSKGNSTVLKWPTQEELYNLSKTSSTTSYSLLIDNPKVCYNSLALNPPVYVNVVTSGTDTYINYFLFYGLNGWYTSSFGTSNLCAGAHTADIEHCTVHIDGSGNLVRIMYARHAEDEFQWVDAKDIEMENGHPVVYIAWRGHGNYQKAGHWYRSALKYKAIIMRMPDITAKDVRWIPSKYVRLYMPTETGFDPTVCGITAYQGYMGFDLDGASSLGTNCATISCTGADASKTEATCNFSAPCLNGWPVKGTFTKVANINSFSTRALFRAPQTQQTGDKLASCKIGNYSGVPC